MKKLYFLLTLSFSTASVKAQVAPLVNTTWNQGCYYNADCPTTGSGGACGRVWTGCGATAYGQILKFYSFPVTGNGSHCNSTAPTHCVDFSAQSYNYSVMPAALSAHNSEVAKLLYHAGISLDMSWSGSVSLSGASQMALKKYYNYSLSIRGLLKALYTNTEWENKVRSELDAGRPVFASGGGHFYIIDGYQLSPLRFHVNFGWGGLYDGMYNIHSIIAGGNDYTPGNLIVGIQPRTQAVETTTDTLTVTAGGGNVPFEVGALAAWTITSNQGWAMPNLTAGTAGYYSFNEGATVNVGTNATYIPRFATITATSGVVTSSFVIQQNGILPSLSVNPSLLTFSSLAGNQTFAISSDSIWTASSPDSWISITPNTGNGNLSVTVEVTANGPVARTGTVIVTRGNLQRTISIEQSSNSSFWCTPALVISGTNGLTNVTLNTINRTSSNNEGYIHAGLSTTLKRDSTYTFSATFTGSVAPAIWIDWNIDGDFNDPGEAIMPPAGSWYPSFTGTKSLNFTVPSTAVEGTTRMRVYVKNFPSPTTSPCNTTDQGGDIEDYDIVVVDHRNLDVNPVALNFIASGQLQNVTVSSDSIWQVTCPAAWINLSAASGSGNGTLGITALANTATTPRSALATFTRGFRTKTVLLEQQGEDSLLNIIETTLSIPATGNTYVVNVISNVDYSITSSAAWITTNTASGSGISSFDVNVGLNALTTSQSGYVVVRSGTNSDTLWIAQDANAATLGVNPSLINFPETASDQLVSITTSGSWIVSSNDAWLTIDINSGSGNGSLTVFAEENTGIARTGSLTVTNGIINEVIVVNQNGINGINDFSADEKPLVFPNPARDMITILSPEYMINAQIEIFSADGKLVIERFATGKSTQLFVESIERGIYLIKLTSTDAVYFVPLILTN